jgi:maleylacetate reductase
MLPSGRVLFGQMDEVVFGKPAAEAIAAQVDRLAKTRVFLMVSNSLNRKTDEIDKVRWRLATAAPARSIKCQHIRRDPP